MPRNLLGPHESRAGIDSTPKFVTAVRWVLLFEAKKPQTAAGTSSQSRRIRQKAENAVTKKKIDRGGSRGKR
jgi:hypothetical protein